MSKNKIRSFIECWFDSISLVEMRRDRKRLHSNQTWPPCKENGHHRSRSRSVYFPDPFFSPLSLSFQLETAELAKVNVFLSFTENIIGCKLQGRIVLQGCMRGWKTHWYKTWKYRVLLDSALINVIFYILHAFHVCLYPGHSAYLLLCTY